MKIWFDTLDYTKIDDDDFTLENVKQLYENISSGVSIEDACALSMIKPEQYYAWLDYDDFRVLMEHAEAKYRAELQKRVTRATQQNPVLAFKQMSALMKKIGNQGNDLYDDLVKIAMRGEDQ